jgi:hypothetical protein
MVINEIYDFTNCTVLNMHFFHIKLDLLLEIYTTLIITQCNKKEKQMNTGITDIQ